MNYDSDFGRDTRRDVRRDKKANRFKNGKHIPRTNKDRRSERVFDKPAEDSEYNFSRSTRRAWAVETKDILDQNTFNNHYILQTKYYPEEKSIDADQDWDEFPDQSEDLEIIFVHETTVEFLWALSEEDEEDEEDEEEDEEKQPLKRIMVLNFASAKNPGGGFLKGSGGQEEALSIASGLYLSQTEGSGAVMYQKNQENPRDGLYLSDAIYSPGVPLFRKSDGTLVDDLETDHLKINILSMPAANYKCYSEKSKFSKEKYDQVMKERINRVYQIALINGCDNLVLGPWGCGVFGGNLPDMMGRFQENPLHKKFKKIYFVSTSEETVNEMDQFWEE